ncbi:protein SIEVE ELEMENT OCCLUSION B [Sesamum alatum]|uniref:Protein SIEVE ELEMENT OCCLUSION B n=1 Tax=Sesamum alatum TaxID=300844 RepID=A0AAE1Y552_9LAMI|nr:protein SIEVE ELEMENT OCCLUSION B [Sesamum alatum]
MAARDFMPPPSTDKVPPVRTPGGGHSFVTDHGLKPSKEHEREHHTVNPRPGSGHMAARGRLGRADRAPNFLSSDDALTKQIVSTHAPDMEDLDVRPVLSIVEDIMRLARPSSAADTTHVAPTQSHVDKLDDKVSHIPYHDDKIYHTTEHDAEIVKVLAYPINKTSCEIICKCSGGGESHAITMDLLKSLSSYSWDAKVVITLAAFSINYGEFWLVEHQYTKNALAKNIATLKDLPDIIAHAGELRKKFEAVLNLLTQVLKVTHCIIEFKELPPLYISRESPEITAATAHIPTAVYWIIRGLLTCASTLLNLIGSGHEYVTSTSESWEIQNLAHKLSVILEHLQDQLKHCKDLIERKKAEDAYIAFKKLMESAHIDNMKVLRAMIRSREDQRPLYHGSRRTNERLEELRLKYVLLLISDLELPHEELNVLHLIYNQHSMRHEYEVLWFPIINSTTSTASLTDPIFYDLRNNHMPWYSVDNPSLIEPVAIRYIREVWNFVHMPMLVVLDPQGKPSNLDALPMMWIWGSAAFPFTKAQERALWADSTWNIQLLADAIDPRIPDWIKENYVICIYGGDDIEWIRKFTLAARAAATALHIHLEMLYVGKRNPKEKVRLCHEVIDKEKLSNVFSVTEYYDYVWYFWVRLWSMWNSKKQMGMTVENDRIMQEIMDVLALDSSEKGWAVFSRANFEITKGNGDKLLPVLENYREWMYKVDHPDKFVMVLDEELKRVHPDHHCNRLILPGHAGYIPERVVCSECGKTMDKYVMYRCCTD